jgi:serine phosphatase RsbU (regulator of sigma subunit)
VSHGDLNRLLSEAEAASPVDAVGAVTEALGQALGAASVSFLIVDLSGRGLVRLTHGPAEPASSSPTDTTVRQHAEDVATTLPFDGGPAERVVRTQASMVLEPAADSLWTILAPVTERGESIGLLELRVPAEPDSRTVDEVARLAHLLGFVVIANRRHTDLFEWGQRSTTLSLSAEIQQRLLPAARTCEGGSFTLSGWLEPASSIAGDTFDYSLARDDLHLSMTDAMGHGVAASLTATLCVGSLRHTRRAGASLLEQADATNNALVEHGGRLSLDDYATGILGRLHLPTGVLALVNAGHVAPFLARHGDVRELGLADDLPFGMFSSTVYRETHVQLEQGDRVVLMTDGMVEQGATALDMPGIIAETHALHPREAVRELSDRVIEAVGQSLADDATVLCVDWNGEHQQPRAARYGADHTSVVRLAEAHT